MSLQEIKERYAKNQGSEDWATFQCDEEIYFDIDDLCKTYAKAKLEEAAERATLKLETDQYIDLQQKLQSRKKYVVDKKSITETPLD